MRFSSSSLVAAALITSSSIPNLAAPVPLHSQKHMTISPGKRLVTSQSENIVHRAAEKDKVHEQEDDGGSEFYLVRLSYSDCFSWKIKKKILSATS